MARIAAIEHTVDPPNLSAPINSVRRQVRFQASLMIVTLEGIENE